MDVDAEAINPGQGRCCHKIINDKKEQKMNDNTNCSFRRTASPVNVMDFDGEEDLSNEIADKIMPMLIQQLSISEVPPDSHQSYGGKVLDILRSKLNLLNTSGVKHSNNSNKRQRTESRDAGSGGSDIIGTSFDNAEKYLDGVGLGGDADIIGTGDCDMSTDADTNEDDLTSNMAVDEESDKNHTAVNNNMPQEKLDNVGSEDVLDASLATTATIKTDCCMDVLDTFKNDQCKLLGKSAQTADKDNGLAESTTASTEEHTTEEITTATTTVEEQPSALVPTKLSYYDKQWLETFNLLKPCIQANGNINYNSLDNKAIKSSLVRWVSTQRSEFRKRENNKKSSLKDWRLRLLEEAKFSFTSNCGVKPGQRYAAASQSMLDDVSRLAQQYSRVNTSTATTTDVSTNDAEVEAIDYNDAKNELATMTKAITKLFGDAVRSAKEAIIMELEQPITVSNNDQSLVENLSENLYAVALPILGNMKKTKDLFPALTESVGVIYQTNYKDYTDTDKVMTCFDNATMISNALPTLSGPLRNITMLLPYGRISGGTMQQYINDREGWAGVQQGASIIANAILLRLNGHYDTAVELYPRYICGLEFSRHFPEKCPALMEAIVAIHLSDCKYVELWIKGTLRVARELEHFRYLVGTLKALNPDKVITVRSVENGLLPITLEVDTAVVEMNAANKQSNSSSFAHPEKQPPLTGLEAVVQATSEREQSLSDIPISHVNAGYVGNFRGEQLQRTVPVESNYKGPSHKDICEEVQRLEKDEDWEKNGLPPILKRAIILGNKAADSKDVDGIHNKFRAAINTSVNRLERHNSSQPDYITAQTEEGQRIIAEEALTVFGEGCICGEDILIYLRKTNGEEHDRSTYIEGMPYDQLLWAYARIKAKPGLMKNNTKIFILLDDGFSRTNMCNNKFGLGLSLISSGQFGTVVMSTTNRANENAIAIQLMLEAENLFPSLKYYFAQNAGQNPMAVAMKETERKSQRLDIYNVFKATKAHIEETFLSTVPLRIKNLHHLVKEVGIQRLTSGFLERIANLHEDVKLLIEKWNQDDDWQLLEQHCQQILRTKISVEVESRHRQERVYQREQERVSQREQEEQERVRQREQEEQERVRQREQRVRQQEQEKQERVQERVRQQEQHAQERVQERVRQKQQLLVEGSKVGCKKCLAEVKTGTKICNTTHDQHCPLSTARARSTASDALQAIKKDGKVGDKFWLPNQRMVRSAEIPNLPNESNEIKVYKIASQTLKSKYRYAGVDKALKEEVNWDFTRVTPYTFGEENKLHLYEFVAKSD